MEEAIPFSSPCGEIGFLHNYINVVVKSEKEFSSPCGEIGFLLPYILMKMVFRKQVFVPLRGNWFLTQAPTCSPQGTFQGFRPLAGKLVSYYFSNQQQ